MFIDSGCALGTHADAMAMTGGVAIRLASSQQQVMGFMANIYRCGPQIQKPLHTHSNKTDRKREAVSEVRLVDVSMNSFDVKSVLKHRPCELHNIEQIYGH